MDPIVILFSYLALLNIYSFYLMGADKKRAINGSRRVPEKTFFSLAFLGGSIGVFIGMNLFRHKTLHRSFSVGMPVIIVVKVLFFLEFLLV